ncbi:MAG: TIGR01440 family protein [Ruminococcaceae bacterium]|nr:TIGR01440 family protein [Oscillospiraceae bacterium]
MFEDIKKQASEALSELFWIAKPKVGDICVVGCSSSEILGKKIGKGSSVEAADAVYSGIAPVLAEHGVFLAAQCCEHLNRALVVERECAEKYGLDPVCVIPQPKAGGSFATAAYKSFKDPVVVEFVKAHVGIDIGDTMIGMHLRHVAVPVRISLKKICEANLVCARTRPKLIGGSRAHYPEETV